MLDAAGAFRQRWHHDAHDLHHLPDYYQLAPLLAGAVSGGGLTVIANAPNPAGAGILQSSAAFSDEGINPGKLFLGALMPTVVAIVFFWLV